MRTSGWLGLLVVLGACGGGDDATTPAKPPAAAAPAAPRRDPIAGGPYPALFVAQAQFVDKVGADGKATSVPGPAKLTIVRCPQRLEGQNRDTLRGVALAPLVHPEARGQ